MKDIILSMPEFYLYLVTVVALLITALWTQKTGSSVGEPRATVRTAGRNIGDARVAARRNHDRAPLWSSALPLHRDCRPFRDLQATLSASYAAKLEQVIRTIRAGSPLERG
jgi:hypothetical protein